MRGGGIYRDKIAQYKEYIDKNLFLLQNVINA